MNQPRPESSPAPEHGRADRPLGRGLEDVARVFLSQGPEERGTVRPLPRDESAPNTLLLRPAVRITREQVAAALKEFLGAIEEGLRCLDSEISCGPGDQIDLLALDRANQLAVIDFDTSASDDLLLRGLGHLDWVSANLSNVRRMFRGQAINFSIAPRLVLLAPQFSPRVRCAARQITQLRIAWVCYHLVETPDRPGILFEPIP